MNRYSLPAEWEKHVGTIATYPHSYKNFFDRLEGARETFIKMLSIISQSEKIFINVNSEGDKKDLIERLNGVSKVKKENVHIFINETDDVWCRDYCPIFVKDEKMETVALKFRFNAWGKKYPYGKDQKAGEKIPQLLGIKKVDVDMVLEGGAIEVNGEGVLITTESCLLNKNRNPNMDKEEIEENLKKYLGVKKIIWLKKGIEGDDTDGHIDNITRFVKGDAVVTVIEKDKTDTNYESLMDNFERLKMFTDTKGNPLKVVTLPLPEPIYYHYPDSNTSHRLPASYANFYITNKHVIVPTFNCKSDETAIQILQKLFPERDVIGIYAYDILVGLGGFHCLTMQLPQ